MADAVWNDDPYTRRLNEVRADRLREVAVIRARRRRRRALVNREVARLLLAAALVTLGVLAVEIGRKAVVVLHDTDTAALVTLVAGHG